MFKMFKRKKRKPQQDDLPTIATPIRLKLTDQEFQFENGEWKADSNGVDIDSEVVALRRENRQLRDEVRLLKFRNEVLIDMLAASNLDVFTLKDQLGDEDAETVEQARNATNQSKR
eukprot:CAMPEP_0184656088 /NCGR_PEP_ID=MMETSP0308-20130426/15543_1 /TAXON_ID=38269 /ORGANISM="Gloeochaete witrockiana, Strain SAG 46.84" /LENGTH=115 /DNA_ID=CAMNT_0027093015 /DNA_START=114 /DNA_END=461 /DNA_ORIENTATION=-